MKRFPSIKKNSEFQTVYKNGKSFANKLLIMYVYPGGGPRTRIGISVSKKVGNSVVRHRAVRLIRECFRAYKDRTDEGLDIVVSSGRRPEIRILVRWKVHTGTCADFITS